MAVWLWREEEKEDVVLGVAKDALPWNLAINANSEDAAARCRRRRCVRNVVLVILRWWFLLLLEAGDVYGTISKYVTCKWNCCKYCNMG
jgi:hypothetical protein